MSSNALNQAAIVAPPTTTTSKATLTSGAWPTALDLTTYAGGWIGIKASSKVHVRFRATTTAAIAATTTDYYLTADVDYQFYIPRGSTASAAAARYLGAKGAGSAGRIFIYASSDLADQG